MHRILAGIPVLGCLALLLSGTIYGQEDKSRFDLDIGYRWKTGFHGSEDLYRSQLDYGEGPKLFSGNFLLSPSEDSRRLFDFFELKLNSWGGEPYNNLGLRVTKQGVYELRFDYLNTHYFNAIPSFANPFFEQGNLLSQHRYDISQRTARFHLALRPGRRVSPFVSYQRTSRQGPLSTTLASGGDEFVLSSDLDLHSDDIRGGVNLSFSKLSLLLEQGFRWYRDETPFSGSAQEGNSSRTALGRDIFLEDYQGKTDVDASIPFSTALAVYRPLEQLSLRGKLSYSIADLDSANSEDINGNFFSQPLAAFYQQGRSESIGASKQPNLLGDFSAEWQPWNRFRLVERVQIRRLHVSGSNLVNSFLSEVDRLFEPDADIETSNAYDTFLSMDTNVQELEGLFYVTPRLAFRLGHRFEH